MPLIVEFLLALWTAWVINRSGLRVNRRGGDITFFETHEVGHDAMLIVAQHRPDFLGLICASILTYQIGLVFVLFLRPKCQVGIFKRIILILCS